MSPRMERVEQMEQVFPILSLTFPFLLVRKKKNEGREKERGEYGIPVPPVPSVPKRKEQRGEGRK